MSEAENYALYGPGAVKYLQGRLDEAVIALRRCAADYLESEGKPREGIGLEYTVQTYLDQARAERET